MEKVMYHYTNSKGWDGIVNGQEGYLVEHPVTKRLVESETIQGWMLPNRRLIPQGVESSLVPWEATSPAIFGLPESQPTSWKNYRDCINVWSHLMQCCRRGEDKLTLLKIHLIDSDHPRVFDYIHLRNAGRELEHTKDSKEWRRILAEGNRNYWNSQVELNHYDQSFTLPEIVVISAIPLDRIEHLGEIEREIPS